MRLITITEEAVKEAAGEPKNGGQRWVNLIHETLIRAATDDSGKPRPYWPTLWNYIEANKTRARHWERLQLMAREWQERRGLSRLRGLAGWSSLFGFRGRAAPGSIEQRYLNWSRARAGVEVLLTFVMLAIAGEGLFWMKLHQVSPSQLWERWAYMLYREIPLPQFTTIPAGTFQMGSNTNPSEQPIHRVTISHPFQISKTEVTFEQWDACFFDGGCMSYFPRDQDWGREKRPVINVTWDHANIYAEWLSKKKAMACRLPSEAEWEYAARAGTKTEYALPAPHGSDDIKGKELANCYDCSSKWLKQTMPVKSFIANLWDLYDMHGNVDEWINDCWNDNYHNAPDDGSSWYQGTVAYDEKQRICYRHVVRGGSWGTAQEDLRSAARRLGNPWDGTRYVGFRVVCSSPSAGL